MTKRRTTRAGAPATGKVEEGLGWVTGDRRTEAEGHLRHRKAEERGSQERVTPNEVDREEQHVRRVHGDIR